MWNPLTESKKKLLWLGQQLHNFTPPHIFSMGLTEQLGGRRLAVDFLHLAPSQTPTHLFCIFALSRQR